MKGLVRVLSVFRKVILVNDSIFILTIGNWHSEGFEFLKKHSLLILMADVRSMIELSKGTPRGEIEPCSLFLSPGECALRVNHRKPIAKNLLFRERSSIILLFFRSATRPCAHGFEHD